VAVLVEVRMLCRPCGSSHAPVEGHLHSSASFAPASISSSSSSYESFFQEAAWRGGLCGVWVTPGLWLSPAVRDMAEARSSGDSQSGQRKLIMFVSPACCGATCVVGLGQI
jgi:hypothetical protein